MLIVFSWVTSWRERNGRYPNARLFDGIKTWTVSLWLLVWEYSFRSITVTSASSEGWELKDSTPVLELSSDSAAAFGPKAATEPSSVGYQTVATPTSIRTFLPCHMCLNYKLNSTRIVLYLLFRPPKFIKVWIQSFFLNWQSVASCFSFLQPTLALPTGRMIECRLLELLYFFF